MDNQYQLSELYNKIATLHFGELQSQHKKEIDDLKSQHQNQIDKLKLQIEDLKTELNEVKLTLTDLLSKRNEQYYQRFLEKKFNVSHQKNIHGITDLSNENTIIEIKEWRNYKSALGQLIAYSHYTDKQK
jgi:hypothetical protein